MHLARLAGAFLLLLLAGCTVNSTPTGPTGSNPPPASASITPPRPVLPAAGARLARDGSPVTLTVENAATNSDKPLTYTFEGSTDAAFAVEVFRQAGIAPGSGGRTSLQVPGQLPAGRTYYWRASATDGSATSPHSEVSHFTVYETFVLSAPQPASPAAGAVVPGAQPTLRVVNAVRTGTAEPVSYEFQVSATDQFAVLAYNAWVIEQPDTTEVTVSPLPAGTRHYWRVRAVSESSTSAWSPVSHFTTPSGATPPPPPALPPSNPGPRPDPREGLAMVEAVIADLRQRGIPMAGDCGAFEITRRVAWNFRNRGAGLERKPGGRNCQGHSIDIVIFTDGQTVDMLIGAGVDNGATWQEHGVLPDWADWWIAPVNPD